MEARLAEGEAAPSTSLSERQVKSGSSLSLSDGVRRIGGRALARLGVRSDTQGSSYRAWRLGAAVAAVVVLGGSGAFMRQFIAGKRTIEGTIVVDRGTDYALDARQRMSDQYPQDEFWNAVDADTLEGPCFPYKDGYDDIRDGTDIEVRDGAGRTLATGSLSEGALEIKPSENILGCSFKFSVQVPTSDFYRISAGRRGEVTFSREDLKNDGWEAHLTLGRE
jgi:hypothetical protein